MTGGTDWSGIILALATLVGAITAAVVSIFGLLRSGKNSVKIEESVAKIDANTVKLDEVHKLTNSLSERVQQEAKAAGLAEGEKKGREQMIIEAGAAALARETAPPVHPIKP